MRKRIPPISIATSELPVSNVWAVVFSFESGHFFIEDLCSAIKKNFQSFEAAAGEDWQIIGIFRSAQEAADAAATW